MSSVFVVWLAVGLVTTLAIAAVLIGLVRHVLGLGRTLRRFQEEVTPIAEEISAEGDRASRRVSGVSASRRVSGVSASRRASGVSASRSRGRHRS